MFLLRSYTNVIKPIKVGFLAIASMENQGLWWVIENGARSQFLGSFKQKSIPCRSKSLLQPISANYNTTWLALSY
ncbi:MAG TPA: hypothetical protein DC064_11855 [Cyanobacteria bacterium UBA9273]|nr:hypothetical protein [Cyanobacteria bacterium UBA9273]